MKALAAVSKNFVIGNNGKLPWTSKEDLQFFKETTWNGRIVVGRTTYKTLPKLKNRVVYILTRDENKLGGGYSMVDGINESFGIFYCKHPNNIPPSDYVFGGGLFLCGGAQVYKEFLKDCEGIYLTEFDFDCKGDTKFPFTKEEIIEMFPKQTLIKTINQGKITYYEKI